MRVFIGFERSGVIRDAFIAAGHDAVSCDLQETAAPGPHYCMDIYEGLKQFGPCDLIILNPMCTKLCVSGNHVYAYGKPRHSERLEAVAFTEKLWHFCKTMAPRVCLENSIGVLTTMTNLPKPQYVQPFEFGDDASKKTALFLHNLPKLAIDEAARFSGRLVEWPRESGKMVERWNNQCDSGQNKLGPSATRSDERAQTYAGIAQAMVTNWGQLA